MQALLRVAPTEPRGPLGRPPTRSLLGRAFPTAPAEPDVPGHSPWVRTDGPERSWLQG
jgi:hypothetical protein